MIDGKVQLVPLEAVLMSMAAGASSSAGKRAVIALLGWCRLGDEVLLIMERPESCMDLREYSDTYEISEDMAKVMKLLLL